MIQRIQSIYLLLAAISLSIIVFLPVGYQSAESGVVANISMFENLPTVVVSILGAALAILDIFLYSNRKLQMKVTVLFILLTILDLGSLALYHFVTGQGLNVTPNYIPYGLSFFALVFGILAYRGIDADDKLVRSMDRLR